MASRRLTPNFHGIPRCPHGKPRRPHGVHAEFQEEVATMAVARIFHTRGGAEEGLSQTAMYWNTRSTPART